MSEQRSAESTEGKSVRLIRRSFWAIGLSLVVALGFAILDQTSNRLIVKYDGSTHQPIIVEISSPMTNDSKPVRRIVIETDSRPPHSSIFRTISIGAEESVGIEIESDSSVGLRAGKWGTRLTAEFTDDSCSGKAEFSPLRKWLFSNRNWIPVPSNWLE